MAMQPAPNFSEAGGPRRRLPMIQRRKFAAGRTRPFLSSPASLPVNPNRKFLTKTLSASEAWGVLLTRRDDYLPVNLLYRHRQAGGVNLAGDHSLLIDLCSLYRSLLGRDVTFALSAARAHTSDRHVERLCPSRPSGAVLLLEQSRKTRTAAEERRLDLRAVRVGRDLARVD